MHTSDRKASSSPRSPSLMLKRRCASALSDSTHHRQEDRARFGTD